MIIKNGIELECLVHNDTTDTLEDLGINYKLSSCDTEKITFYSIDFVTPYQDPEDEEVFLTEINSGGKTFICNENYGTLKLKIQNATKV